MNGRGEGSPMTNKDQIISQDEIPPKTVPSNGGHHVGHRQKEGSKGRCQAQRRKKVIKGTGRLKG